MQPNPDNTTAALRISVLLLPKLEIYFIRRLEWIVAPQTLRTEPFVATAVMQVAFVSHPREEYPMLRTTESEKQRGWNAWLTVKRHPNGITRERDRPLHWHPAPDG